jgi:type II secretory pathway component PulF
MKPCAWAGLSSVPLYQYQATDAKGKAVRGIIDAASSGVAYQKLKSQGMFPTNVTQDVGRRGKAAGADSLAYTIMQLAALLRCGIPVDEALESLLETEENPRLRMALARVRVRLREGDTLAGAMAVEEIFPQMLLRMVEAGEETGKPGEILGRYSEYLKRDLEHRQALMGALSYPAVLTVLSVSLLFGLLYFLTPVLNEMYTSLGVEKPMLTRGVLALGDFVTSYGIYLIAGLVVMLWGSWAAVPRTTRDSWILSLPLIGPMLKCGLMERWSRTLGMLHEAGVPLVRSLQLSRESLDNEALSVLLASAEKGIELGEGLSVTLARVYLIPPLLQQFLRTGEKTGELELMLNSAASFYERELDRRRSILVRFMEPALIVGLGVMVGLLVMSVLLPLADISSKLNV